MTKLYGVVFSKRLNNQHIYLLRIKFLILWTQKEKKYILLAKLESQRRQCHSCFW